MKIICRTQTKMSLYVLQDDEVLHWDDRGMVIGEPAWLIVSDCPTDSISIYEGAAAPADWCGGKYLFDGFTWAVSPDWVEPLPPTPESEPQP